MWMSRSSSITGSELLITVAHSRWSTRFTTRPLHRVSTDVLLLPVGIDQCMDMSQVVPLNVIRLAIVDMETDGGISLSHGM